MLDGSNDKFEEADMLLTKIGSFAQALMFMSQASTTDSPEFPPAVEALAEAQIELLDAVQSLLTDIKRV